MFFRRPARRGEWVPRGAILFLFLFVLDVRAAESFIAGLLLLVLVSGLRSSAQLRESFSIDRVALEYEKVLSLLPSEP